MTVCFRQRVNVLFGAHRGVNDGMNLESPTEIPGFTQVAAMPGEGWRGWLLQRWLLVSGVGVGVLGALAMPMELVGNSTAMLERSLPQTVAQSNIVIPALVVIGFMIVRRFIGGLFSIIPLAALVLLILGSDSEARGIISGDVPLGGILPKGFSMKEHWPIVVIGGLLLYLLLRDFLFYRRGIVLPLLAVGLLLVHRDYRIQSLATNSGQASLALILGGLFVVFLLWTFFSRLMFRLRYPWACPPLISPYRIAMLMPTFKLLGGLFVGVVALCLVIKPAWLTAGFPGWQYSLGLTALFVAIWGLATSLPPRIRIYLVPGYWLLVVAVLATQVSFSPEQPSKPARSGPRIESGVAAF